MSYPLDHGHEIPREPQPRPEPNPEDHPDDVRELFPPCAVCGAPSDSTTYQGNNPVALHRCHRCADLGAEPEGWALSA